MRRPCVFSHKMSPAKKVAPPFTENQVFQSSLPKGWCHPPLEVALALPSFFLNWFITAPKSISTFLGYKRSVFNLGKTVLEPSFQSCIPKSSSTQKSSSLISNLNIFVIVLCFAPLFLCERFEWVLLGLVWVVRDCNQEGGLLAT